MLAGTTAGAQTPGYEYQTTIPGYYLDSGRGIAVDDDGNAFVIARAIGDYEQNNVLVSKLGTNGIELWSTYIDALDHDYAEDLIIDAAGDLLVTGWTDSDGFPVTDTLGVNDFRAAFVMRLSSDDGSIISSTLIGGDYTDMGGGIALNDAGEIYIVGTTGSTDFPTTPDAYQPGPTTPFYIYSDAFIMKLNPDADEILCSTYFGATRDDWGYHIGLEGDGSVVISGKTLSEDFPLVDPVQPDTNTIFLSKFSPDMSSLEFSTCIGGEGYDRLWSMTTDADDMVYLAGSTRSEWFPTTTGAFQDTFVGEVLGCETAFPVTHFNCDDGFVTKLATDGTGIEYGTFLGGTDIDQVRDVAVDGLGNAYVVGYTISPDFPGASEGGPAYIFTSKLDDQGEELEYTLVEFSGSANSGHGIDVMGGSVYFTGSLGVPADVYVAKLGRTGPTGVEEPADATGVRLLQNTPNPFNPRTSIAFEMSAMDRVDLTIHDAAGRVVRRLLDDRRYGPGRHSIGWDGTDDLGHRVGTGVYFYRVTVGNETETRRMLLLK
jgi:hypothetical protein